MWRHCTWHASCLLLAPESAKWKVWKSIIDFVIAACFNDMKVIMTFYLCAYVKVIKVEVVLSVAANVGISIKNPDLGGLEKHQFVAQGANARRTARRREAAHGGYGEDRRRSGLVDGAEGNEERSWFLACLVVLCRPSSKNENS